MASDFVPAWVPYQQDRPIDDAAILAIAWAEDQAAARGLQPVLVTDEKGGTHGASHFAPLRDGRHASPRGSGVTVRPGAVIAHVPGRPQTLELATRLARGNALVLVDHPSPWLKAGWAAVLGAQNLDTGQTEPSLPPALVDRLNELVSYGNNGYARGFGRDRARQILQEMHAENQLDRDVVLSALSTFDTSSRALDAIDSLIGTIVPRSVKY
ncbi:hypothetical protein ACFWIW_28190 [Amycolatopsis sp. NPDC058340]|uniref:hypothetical protein n=1 Tax=Amycolatopsis sp. NPDC058340 TaxID=3346453 RepID=UPI00365E6AD3